MKFLVLLFALSLSVNSFSAEKTKKTASLKSSSTKTMKELGKIDSNTLDIEGGKDAKAEAVDETALYTEPGKMKVNFSCKAKDGHEIKQGEQGYDECLQKVKNDKNNPHEPNADIKVHLGN